MGRKIGTICMIAGAVLIGTALSLFVWNQWKDRQAAISVERVLPQIEDYILEQEDDETTAPEPYDPEMTEVIIDGYAYIGYISIPSLSLDLPVMSTWSYEQLDIAPCRYHGSTKTDDLVIAAHNYIRHFAPLKNLLPGDEVYFTDMDGKITAYAVAEVDTLNPTAVEEMTDSGFALTLFTCTYGGQSRVTVRCDKAE